MDSRLLMRGLSRGMIRKERPKEAEGPAGRGVIAAPMRPIVWQPPDPGREAADCPAGGPSRIRESDRPSHRSCPAFGGLSLMTWDAESSEGRCGPCFRPGRRP